MKTHYVTIGENNIGKYQLYYLVDTTGYNTWNLFLSQKEIKQYVDHYGYTGDIVKVMLRTPLLFPGTREEMLKFFVDETLNILADRGVMTRGKLYGDPVFFLKK